MMQCLLSVVWQVIFRIHDPAIWYCVARNTNVFTDRSCGSPWLCVTFGGETLKNWHSGYDAVRLQGIRISS